MVIQKQKKSINSFKLIIIMDDFFDSLLDDSIPQQSEQKICKEQISDRIAPNSSLQDKQSLEDSLHKNKYVKKLKQILPEQDSLKNKSAIDSKSKQSGLDRRERNKQAAKQTRDRKKLYINLMEEKKKNLEKQLSMKQNELEQAQAYLKKILQQNQTINSFTIGRFQLIKKLQSILQKYQKMPQCQRNTAQITLDSQMNEVMDILRYKIGATGKQRVNTINQYFQQIINLSLPALHRYVLWSAENSKHLFAENEEQQLQDDWFKQLWTSLNLSEEQVNEIRSMQESLVQKKHVLIDLIKSMKDVKQSIYDKSIQLQGIVDSLRQILSPLQCAHFILFIEKNKYSKELNLCQEQTGQTIRKMIKKQ